MPKDKGKPQQIERRICALIFAGPKIGKSWLGATTPAPRLVIDVEGGSSFAKRVVDGKKTKQRIIRWDPHKDPPPKADGTWDTCQVIVLKHETLERTYKWLETSDHDFASVVIDSLTEVQKRCKDAISGVETPSERDWGALLIRMEHLVRAFRDLHEHPTHPIKCVVILALMDDRKEKKVRPAVQGALSVSLPGYVDLEGYLYVSTDEEGTQTRVLLINPLTIKGVTYECGDRTDDLTEYYGPAITAPDFEQMLAVINES